MRNASVLSLLNILPVFTVANQRLRVSNLYLTLAVLKPGMTLISTKVEIYLRTTVTNRNNIYEDISIN
jgi:hypothetical protein